MKITDQQLLDEINVARASLARLELLIRRRNIASSEESPETTIPDVPGAFLGSGKEITHATPQNAVEGLCGGSDAIPDGMTQPDLFDGVPAMPSKTAGKPNENAENKRKYGAPKLSKKRVMANYRQIAKSNDQLLDLVDVNRIFGYSPKTGGSFIRYAIRRGDLRATYVGRMQKFLAFDVRNFIATHYERTAQSGENK